MALRSRGEYEELFKRLQQLYPNVDLPKLSPEDSLEMTEMKYRYAVLTIRQHQQHQSMLDLLNVISLVVQRLPLSAVDALLPLANGNVDLAKQHAEKYLKNYQSSPVVQTVSDVAAFFEDSNFNGNVLAMPTNDLTYNNLSNRSPNLYNKVSSVWCYDNQYYCILYNQINYAGTYWSFRAPTVVTNLSTYNFNDQTKSIYGVYIGGTPTITYFKDNQQSGLSVLYLAGVNVSDMSTIPIGNDSLSSMILMPGCGVTLYRDTVYGGPTVSYTNDTGAPKLINLGGTSYNDWCSSFQSYTL